MISSNEILTLINALGLDPKSQEIDLKDLRYGKVIKTTLSVMIFLKKMIHILLGLMMY